MIGERRENDEFLEYIPPGRRFPGAVGGLLETRGPMLFKLLLNCGLSRLFLRWCFGDESLLSSVLSIVELL